MRFYMQRRVSAIPKPVAPDGKLRQARRAGGEGRMAGGRELCGLPRQCRYTLSALDG